MSYWRDEQQGASSNDFLSLWYNLSVDKFKMSQLVWVIWMK